MLRLGRAMREILTYFKWMRVAMFYTDDKVFVKYLLKLVLFFSGDAQVPVGGAGRLQALPTR